MRTSTAQHDVLLSMLAAQQQAILALAQQIDALRRAVECDRRYSTAEFNTEALVSGAGVSPAEVALLRELHAALPAARSANQVA
ncbi:MAG: hypothetical protein NZM12_10720 [Steroidobacteraceae bacterium]|nr:hypothetical protein [Steroidobacteraceae bacterium]MDW8258381.1 hypothetical protein [Gammaproteobacteria bacterium]